MSVDEKKKDEILRKYAEAVQRGMYSTIDALAEAGDDAPVNTAVSALGMSLGSIAHELSEGNEEFKALILEDFNNQAVHILKVLNGHDIQNIQFIDFDGSKVEQACHD